MKSLRLRVSLHNSSWPGLLGFRIFRLISSLIITLKVGIFHLLRLPLIPFRLLVFIWCKDIRIERSGGEYSLQTLDNLKFSLCLFVLREAILFFSFFWSYLHFSLSPSIYLGHTWPPVGLSPIRPMGVPLFNTLLLIRRGVTLTWRHHLTICGSRSRSLWTLTLTCLLGIFFLANQVVEFSQGSFSVRDRVLGRVLFTLTGFHGFHVFVGVVLLLLRGGRLFSFRLRSLSHTFFELSIWYWHFVDCIWLLVYTFIYWWGR